MGLIALPPFTCLLASTASVPVKTGWDMGSLTITMHFVRTFKENGQDVNIQTKTQNLVLRLNDKTFSFYLAAVVYFIKEPTTLQLRDFKQDMK